MNIENILYILTYLIIYSFLGWVLESISKTIEQRKFINSGFLKGPFCPIYGFGAIIMILCLSSLKQNIILLFIVSFLILSIWEYIVGVFLERTFKTKYWDYSHLRFNIKGRVCLKNSIYWGILGVVFINIIHPFIESYITQIPMNMLIYVDIILVIAFVVDAVTSIIAVTNFEIAIDKLNDIGDSIKQKVEELKNIKDLAKQNTATENIETVIKELKIRQTRLKIRIYKHAIRLKKAFPTMNSETITEFLNQKIELDKLKKYIKKGNKE